MNSKETLIHLCSSKSIDYPEFMFAFSNNKYICTLSVNNKIFYSDECSSKIQAELEVAAVALNYLSEKDGILNIKVPTSICINGDEHPAALETLFHKLKIEEPDLRINFFSSRPFSEEYERYIYKYKTPDNISTELYMSFFIGGNIYSKIPPHHYVIISSTKQLSQLISSFGTEFTSSWYPNIMEYINLFL
jgi:hypothetical protein